jgi:hypothetical protein
MQLIIKNELGTSVIEITPELKEVIVNSNEDEEVVISPVVRSENGEEVKLKKSFRIQIEEDDVEFMEEYKGKYGTPIQWFVESSIKEKIMRIRLTSKKEDHVI